jgi:hypothetical protein
MSYQNLSRNDFFWNAYNNPNSELYKLLLLTYFKNENSKNIINDKNIENITEIFEDNTIM